MGRLANDGSEIRVIEARIYRCPVAEPFGYAKGFLTMRESAVARLETADGTVGWGEAYAPAAPAAAAIVAIAHRFLQRSVFEQSRIVTETAARYGDESPNAPLAAARSAVALAALDAAGRLLGRPAWALLGGMPDPPLRMYASALWFQQGVAPTAHYGDALRAAHARGLTAVKAKIGLGLAGDLETIRQLGAAGAGMAVMVDANQAYHLDEAHVVAQAAGEAGLVWLEEPLPPSRLADYAALRAGSAVAIAGGETVTSAAEARRWLAADAIDIIQPDPCLAGGLAAAVAIADLTAGTGVVLAPHCFGLGIGLAASLHWAAVIAARGTEEPIWIEVDTSPNPARDALLAHAPWFLDAGTTLRVPDEPGLGVPDLDHIAAFRVL